MNLDADKFKGKYRIPTTRLKFWDYGSNAIYFVTICIKDRVCSFGNIRDGQMYLSEIGQAASDCWLAIPQHFPFVLLDEFVIMPNHAHGVLAIVKPDDDSKVVANTGVETQNLASLRGTQNIFGPQSQNLASIMRGYKIGVTNFCRRTGHEFVWQPRYYDHVVRNLEGLERIRKYIRENPQNWATDQLNDF